MQNTSMDDWRFLCGLASHEQDPQKLLELLTRINRALEKCHQQSRAAASFKVDAFCAPATNMQYAAIASLEHHH